MKKILFTLLTLCLCGTTWAYDFSVTTTTEGDDGTTSTTIYYNYVLNGEERADTIINNVSYPTVEVTWGGSRQPSATGTTNVYEGDITIPATVVYPPEGEDESTTCYVVGLGSYAFSRSADLTSLVIPNTINYLETCCVYNCSGLKNVTIEYDATPLEIRCTDTNNLPAFGYSQIETLELDRDLYIVDSEYSTPFYNNTYIQNVIIGENVTELTAHAFEKCSKLTEVTVSNKEDGGCSLTTIGDNAFSQCTALEHITIPASVTTFGDDCFTSCSALRNVFLLATNPSGETLHADDFQNDTDVTLYVPRGCAAAYYASDWQTLVVSRGNVSFNFYNLTTISEDTKYEDEDEGSTYYYATYYYDGAGEGVNDIYEVDDTSKTLYAVTGVNEGVVKMEALKGDIIPKNTPLLIESSEPGAYYMWRNYYETDVEGNPTPFYSDEPTEISLTGISNMLYGHSESGYTSASNGTYNEEQVEDYYFYKLSLLGENQVGSVGFYWGASDGGSYEAGAHRCWLAVLKDSANGAEGISIKKDNGGTTGISSIESASEKSVSGIYTIQGVRVSNMNQPGLYIVDGKKVLVK